MELSEFLTVETPLGPFRHERIMRLTHNPHSDFLLYQVGLFDEIIARARPLVIGRRGSGKTAIVNAFLSAAGHVEGVYARGARRTASDNCYVFINSWDHLDELVEKVGREVAHTMGSDQDWTAVLPETVARKWTAVFWHLIFQELYKEIRGQSREKARMPAKLVNRVSSYITGRDFISGQEKISQEAIESAVQELRTMVSDWLKDSGLRCFIIIDSLELYPVESPKFLKVLSGFLKAINEFSDMAPRVRVICCVPDEIKHVLVKGSSARLKDLSSLESVSRLAWKPIDLLRIVAERYRAFLQIHDKKTGNFSNVLES